jgi:hypothetical protein
VRQARDETDALFTVGLAETADGLAGSVFDRVPDDFSMVLAEIEPVLFRHREQYFAKDLKLMNQVMRRIVGHIGPFTPMGARQIGPGDDHGYCRFP